jgi:hypothetical protein
MANNENAFMFRNPRNRRATAANISIEKPIGELTKIISADKHLQEPTSYQRSAYNTVMPTRVRSHLPPQNNALKSDLREIQLQGNK